MELLLEMNKNNGFKDQFSESDQKLLGKENNPVNSSKKGPLSFLSGSITSALFAWFSLLISRKLVIYFALHSPNYSSQIAQSIASGFKTLIIGVSFLATFTFAFIGLGLAIVFIRSLFDARKDPHD